MTFKIDSNFDLISVALIFHFMAGTITASDSGRSGINYNLNIKLAKVPNQQD